MPQLRGRVLPESVTLSLRTGGSQTGWRNKASWPCSLDFLYRLAKRYAVCNRWFSSIPGPTLPNRLYAHAGTSDKRLDLSAEEIGTSRTIYEVLDDADVSSTIYADGWTTTATFARLMKYQDQFFGTLDDFYQDCYDNNLPAYCFLEPRYSSGMVNGIFLPQNDQHPDSDVAELQRSTE